MADASGPEEFTPAPGVVYDVDMQAYLTGPGLSKTGMATILDLSPMHYHIGHTKESDTLRAGSLLHCMVLEPKRFKERYVLEPDPALFRKKDGTAYANPRACAEYKAAVAALLAANPGTELVTIPKHADALEIATSLRRHAVFETLLGGDPLCERSIWWDEDFDDPETHETATVTCKARPDAHAEQEGRVVWVDLKSTKSAEPRAFGKQSNNLRYHMGGYLQSKALWVAYGKPVVGMAFAFEKTPPFPHAVYLYTGDRTLGSAWEPTLGGSMAMRMGKADVHQALGVYLTCLRRDKWTGYNEGRIVPISIPKWRQREFEEESIQAAPSEPF